MDAIPNTLFSTTERWKAIDIYSPLNEWLLILASTQYMNQTFRLYLAIHLNLPCKRRLRKSAVFWQVFKFMDHRETDIQRHNKYSPSLSYLHPYFDSMSIKNLNAANELLELIKFLNTGDYLYLDPILVVCICLS